MDVDRAGEAHVLKADAPDDVVDADETHPVVEASVARGCGGHPAAQSQRVVQGVLEVDQDVGFGAAGGTAMGRQQEEQDDDP